MECFAADKLPNLGSLKAVLVPDEMTVEITCPRGHVNYGFIQEDRFEVLSEIALCAFTDGYYREAIASIASSLERLYEFYMRAIFETKDASEEFEKLWKKMSNQSERQLGAFISIYTLEQKMAPELLSDTEVSLRNQVIHKGKIPSQAEAVKFITAAMRVAHPLINEMKSEPLLLAVQKIIGRRGLEVAQKAANQRKTTTTIGTRTFFSLSHVEVETDIRKAVVDRMKQKEVFSMFGRT